MNKYFGKVCLNIYFLNWNRKLIWDKIPKNKHFFIRSWKFDFQTKCLRSWTLNYIFCKFNHPSAKKGCFSQKKGQTLCNNFSGSELLCILNDAPSSFFDRLGFFVFYSYFFITFFLLHPFHNEFNFNKPFYCINLNPLISLFNKHSYKTFRFSFQ